jgi:hypothetical protein
MMWLDDRYAGRELNTQPSQDFIGSILASSTSGAFPYATWITLPLPSWTAFVILDLALTSFWFLTAPSKKKTPPHRDRVFSNLKSQISNQLRTPPRAPSPPPG